MAEALAPPGRRLYTIIYRHPADPEPVVLAVGPQLQELGERFSLVLSQGALSGRTVVWLTLARDCALSEVLDPISQRARGRGRAG